MTNDIYQLSKEPITADDFITADYFDDVEISFADGLRDYDEDELEKAYATFPLMGIFKRDGDCLTYLGAGDICKRWYEQAGVGEFNVDNISSGILRHKLTRNIEQPFTLDRFMIEDDAMYPMSSGDFLTYVLQYLDKGDKLYLGGVVDFHF